MPNKTVELSPEASAIVKDAQSQLARVEGQLALQRQQRITAVVDSLVQNFQVHAQEAPAAIARAMGDETYLAELQMRPQVLPGHAPLNSGIAIVGEDARNTMAVLQKHCVSGPQCGSMTREQHVFRGQAIASIWSKERERILPVLNAAAANNIDAGLKRVAILNETIRAFAKRVLPLRLFATRFLNVPLEGTDEVEVPYYPLQTAASSNRDVTANPSYVFGQATTSSAKKITLNKLKYQPLDYSSAEFRRQPWFDAVKLGLMNAEKLGVDVVTDVLSVVTAARFGNAALTSAAAAMTSDDIVSLRGACVRAMWPEAGRSLIVDSTVDDSLQKDPAYKLALNIGTASVIQQGQMPMLSGFEFAAVPNLPDNGEKLIGFAAFMSGILFASAPIAPAAGVRAQLFAYEVVTDPATGISFDYRHWGEASADRDFEVVECAYGYEGGEAQAIKRICAP